MTTADEPDLKRSLKFIHLGNQGQYPQFPFSLTRKPVLRILSLVFHTKTGIEDTVPGFLEEPVTRI
jgi:hypothetical protein